MRHRSGAILAYANFRAAAPDPAAPDAACGATPDWKIVVNSILASIAELRAHMILVNPFENPEANFQNRAPLRESMRLLSDGGALD
jgi:hypothetical protein